VQLVGRHPQPSDLVFPGPDGGPQGPRDADRFRADLVAAGCPTKYGTEDITYKDGTRHSFATWLGAAGVPDELIGRLMGHSARSVTRRHYVGEDLAVLQAAIEKIVLDVSTGQVITLPLAVAAAGASEADPRYNLTAELTAGLTAGRGKGGSERIANLAKVQEFGGVAEWLKAPVLKTGVLARVPWVRIPPPPLISLGFVSLLGLVVCPMRVDKKGPNSPRWTPISARIRQDECIQHVIRTAAGPGFRGLPEQAVRRERAGARVDRPFLDTERADSYQHGAWDAAAPIHRLMRTAR